MNTQQAKVDIEKKLSTVTIPGKRGKHVPPTSKSDLIRKLSEKLTTGEIKKKLEEVGLKVHYSEIYGAIGRTSQPV